ncbi:hypothetical protein V8D89_002076 [Ganoderma adspersum]
MAPLAIRDASGSSPPNTGMIIGIAAGAVVALAVLFAIAAALVPGSRVRRYFTPPASGYASNNRSPAENRAAPRSGIRSMTTRVAANNDTILMRENNGVVMTLDNDIARVASMSPPDEASVPLVHAPTSPPDSPTSPSAGHLSSPTAVRCTPAHTLAPAVTASVQDPPPPYSVVSSL